MTLAVGIAFLFNIIKFENSDAQKYVKFFGWVLIIMGVPEYILSIINLIARF